MDSRLYGHPEGKQTLQSILSRGTVYGVSTHLTLVSKSSVNRFESATDLPIYDSVLNKDFEDETRYKFSVAFARMPLQDFIKIQAKLAGISPSKFMTDDDPHFFEDHAKGKLKEPFHSGDLPTPYLEFSLDGSINSRQEGRHRAYLMKEAGNEMIDVLLAVKVR